MSFLDSIKDGIQAVVPQKTGSRGIPSRIPSVHSGRSGHGMVPYDDDEMIVSKPAIVFYIGQVFFNFLSMACFASVAAFQAHWHVGPSGLSGFAIFITVMGMLLSLFLMLVPVLYEKYDKFPTLARALKEDRVSFILTGTGSVASLLIAFIVTISAWTEPGCKNADNDPNASKGNTYKNALPGWCNTKKAAAVFMWIVFVFWCASIVLLVLDWRSGKKNRPRDPPFVHPPSVHDHDDLADDDIENTYEHIPSPNQQPVSSNSNNYYSSSSPAPRLPPIERGDGNPFSDINRYSAVSSTAPSGGGGSSGYPASRPSLDAYGAFSDPAPSGYGGSVPPASMYSTAPSTTTTATNTTSNDGPRISRTMQYADPYAAVRASLAGGTTPSPGAYVQDYR